MARGENSGNVNITADGAVISSGQKLRIYNVVTLSASAAQVKLYDGTSASGTLIDSIDVTANVASRVNYENGKLFASGCYADITGSITGCNIECSALA